MTKEEETKFLQEHKCKDCRYLVSMCSHPCIDHKPLSNKLGYACIMFWATSEDKDGSIIPNWNPEWGECEAFEERKLKVAPEIQHTTNGLVAPVVSQPATQIFKSCKLCGRELNSLGICPNCIN